MCFPPGAFSQSLASTQQGKHPPQQPLRPLGTCHIPMPLISHLHTGTYIFISHLCFSPLLVFYTLTFPMKSFIPIFLLFLFSFSLFFSSLCFFSPMLFHTLFGGGKWNRRKIQVPAGCISRWPSSREPLHHCHLLPISWIASDRSFHSSSGRVGNAAYDRHICSSHRTCLELVAQLHVSPVILQPRR